MSVDQSKVFSGVVGWSGVECSGPHANLVSALTLLAESKFDPGPSLTIEYLVGPTLYVPTKP